MNNPFVYILLVYSLPAMGQLIDVVLYWLGGWGGIQYCPAWSLAECGNPEVKGYSLLSKDALYQWLITLYFMSSEFMYDPVLLLLDRLSFNKLQPVGKKFKVAFPSPPQKNFHFQ